MSSIWSDESKYKNWLRVEIAVCEAWAENGRIPKEAVEEIKARAGFDVETIHQGRLPAIPELLGNCFANRAALQTARARRFALHRRRGDDDLQPLAHRQGWKIRAGYRGTGRRNLKRISRARRSSLQTSLARSKAAHTYRAGTGGGGHWRFDRDCSDVSHQE